MKGAFRRPGDQSPCASDNARFVAFDIDLDQIHFTQVAEQFQSSVTVHHDGRVANGKSIWDLMALAAMPGSEVTLHADGPDAPQALDALSALMSTPPEDPSPDLARGPGENCSC